MKNILVPIDLSSATQAVIDHAALVSGSTGAKLWLVHIAAPDPDFVGFKVGPSYVREHRADILRQEHQEIQALASDLQKRGLNVEALLVQGPTVETIMEMVEKVDARSIIMGSHGKGALYRAFVGSVSEQVLRFSKVPVTIVPSPDRP